MMPLKLPLLPAPVAPILNLEYYLTSGQPFHAFRFLSEQQQGGSGGNDTIDELSDKGMIPKMLQNGRIVFKTPNN